MTFNAVAAPSLDEIQERSMKFNFQSSHLSRLNLFNVLKPLEKKYWRL